ncbi:MAG: hypothetical protein NC819_00820 [Candidatus Omnitrophica bacterium]|nr:hypothetical protein [Candidatus Omnitrophota bacterium]
MRQITFPQKGLLLLSVMGLVLASSGSAWAGSSCGDDWGHHRRSHHKHHGHYGYSWHAGKSRVSITWGHRWPVTHYSYFSSAPVYVDRTVVVQASPADTFVINVPNANGSYTPVVFRRVGGTYIGPRGEYYLAMPTVEQLSAVYGLQ